jgi:predicted transposase/invertase (TIGR01784 family)
MDEIQNPHDQFIRSVLSKPKLARDFLQNYLPPQVIEKLNLATLKITQESFVGEQLHQHHTDLLFRGKTKNNAKAFVYILLEHKSSPDSFVAFQLLRYIVRIWEKEKEKSKKLPPIIPLVLYHGKSRWTISRKFENLVENAADFGDFIPRFDYELVDLSAFSETEIKGQAMLQVALSTLRHIFSPNIEKKLTEIFSLLKQSEEQGAVEFLGTVLRYLTATDDKVTEEDIRTSLEEAFPEKENKVMASFVVKYIEQGRQEGQIMLMLRQLKRKFGELQISITEQIQLLSNDKLEELSDLILEIENKESLEKWLSENK